MSKMNRRDSLKLIAAGPVGATIPWNGTPEEEPVQPRLAHPDDDGTDIAMVDAKDWEIQFFNEHQLATVVAVIDIIIPADEKSGSASDAFVHHYIDYQMLEHPTENTGMTGGIAWIDRYCRDHYENNFKDCTAEQQIELVEQIAYPSNFEPHMKIGVEWFTKMREHCSTGFWSSKMGMEDLEYMGNGNTMLPEWNGAPQAALDHLGVSYDD